MQLLALTGLLVAAATASATPGTGVTFPPHLVGTTAAVAALLERVMPGSSARFDLAIAPSCPGVPAGKACFTLADGAGGATTSVTATSASELTGGIGVYLREYCNMTIGWPRGGGSRIFTPKSWPLIGALPVTRARSVPFSHVTQVCTHSYTLVWHDWEAWEAFIDWMALAGHNSIVAPTGQEELQYKVFTEVFGLTDMEVRNWTNGPGFLTWSRGQNSHGNGIAGPLPRSFMRGQWVLQQQILARYRDLGIAGHQPAFAGYAPWALAVRQNDTGKGGATRGKIGKDWDTAWIDGRDPLFTHVADAWMRQALADFGSDHVWQMDAFFGNGTGWGASEEPLDAAADRAAGPCVWSGPQPNTYLKGCATAPHDPGMAVAPVPAGNCPSFTTVAEAQTACAQPQYSDCTGITTHNGRAELRAGSEPIAVPASDNETSYVLLNALACKWDLPPDPVYLARAKAAYGAIARADGPTARWIYQGWAIHVPGSGMSPPSPTTLSRLHGFSSAAPPGQFILLDMHTTGVGQWRSPWQGVWGIPFIWTSLPNFGGNMAMHGNLSQINEIPFAAPPLAPVPAGYSPATQAVGVGYTPEGLDQNPVYYELLQEAAFKAAPEVNLTAWLVRRAHRRYGLVGGETDADVTSAWAGLGASGYANEGPVHDGTGVGQVPAKGFPDWTGFDAGGRTPKPALCSEWRAWGSLLAAAPRVPLPLPKTYTYDLVDVGREVLAQLTIPVSLNFSAALNGKDLNAAQLRHTGELYVQVLRDLDSLLATDSAFLLGTWLASARKLGGNATDCDDTAIGDLHCDDFMEWNARAQITTWHPAPSPTSLGNGPNDYARKQWAGLVADYYAARVGQYLVQALADASAGRPFNWLAMGRREAQLAYQWQTDFGNKYPTGPVGDPVKASSEMRAKYAGYFAAC